MTSSNHRPFIGLFNTSRELVSVTHDAKYYRNDGNNFTRERERERDQHVYDEFVTDVHTNEPKIGKKCELLLQATMRHVTKRQISLSTVYNAYGDLNQAQRVAR